MAKIGNSQGTSQSSYQLEYANRLKNETDGLSVRNEADDAFQNLSVKRAPGTSNDHATTYLDLTDASIIVEFDFDGSSPPAAGANTGKKGFCHTSGGSYLEGQVYRDDGTTDPLPAVVIIKGRSLATKTAITGTISLQANGLYIAESATPPYSWTTKGDGTGSDVGKVKWIKVAVGTAATDSSTAQVPDGSSVEIVKTTITTPFSAGAAISIAVDGTADLVIQTLPEAAVTEAKTYQFDIENGAGDVTASTAGPVTVTKTGAPGAGAAIVKVGYIESFLV